MKTDTVKYNERVHITYPYAKDFVKLELSPRLRGDRLYEKISFKQTKKSNQPHKR